MSSVHCVKVTVGLQKTSVNQSTHPGRTPHAEGHGLILLVSVSKVGRCGLHEGSMLLPSYV